MSTTAVSPSKAKKETNFNQVKVGTIISETQYYTVVAADNGSLDLRNEDGDVIEVSKDYAEKCLNTADQFTETISLSRTEIAQIFIANPYVAMTVNYNKKVDDKAVLADILDVHQNTAPKDVEKAFKAAIKKGLEGEERTALGRHAGSVDDFGRVRFIDMQKDKGSNPAFDGRNILVDPRTINFLILKGKKYITK